MNSSGSSLMSVLLRFPDRQQAIRHLYFSDHGFRELCDHYVECEKVLNRMKKASEEDESHREEYRALTEELATEIKTVAHTDQT